MASLKHLRPDCSSEALSKALKRDGAVIIDSALPRSAVDRLRRELAPYIAAGKEGENDFSGKATKRIGALIARAPTTRLLALDERINNACERVLGPFGNGYQLHFTQAVNIGPRETEQPLHRDRSLWGDQIPMSIETQLSTIWAVSDFTRANGATRVVPGSHLWDPSRAPKQNEIDYAEMASGSVMIYTGSIIHGGGGNETTQDRLGVLLHYAQAWLRQEENQYLSCPPQIAGRLDPKLRALIGYSRGGPNLGFYSAPVGPGKGVELANPEKMFPSGRQSRSIPSKRIII